MYTIGQLAKRFGLSRSTLLYYDSIGLLAATDRTETNYRKYSEEDLRRLEQICMYRQVGLPLEDIKKILDSPGNLAFSLLERRLDELNEQIAQLRRQQHLIVQALQNDQLLRRINAVDRDSLVATLYAAGLDDKTLMRWHADFERLLPDEHQSFLELLGIDAEEIEEIRQWSRGYQDVEE